MEELKKDIERVCLALGTNAERVCSRDRHQRISDQRTALIYALGLTGKYTYKDIGKAVGRCHSCVREATMRVQTWMKYQHQYSQQCVYVIKANMALDENCKIKFVKNF